MPPRENQPHRSIGLTQQLTVKQIGRHRLFYRHRLSRYDNGRKPGNLPGKLAHQLRLIDERACSWQNSTGRLLTAITSFGKYPFINHRRILSGKITCRGLT